MLDTPMIPEMAPDPSLDPALIVPPETAPDVAAAAGRRQPHPVPSVADTARLLANHFPALFGAGVIKPIKLRIHADIHQRAPGVFTKKALSVFLQRHTTGTAYLRALVAKGATRADLDGQPVGEVAVEHREAAASELDRRRAIADAKSHQRQESARASRRDAHVSRPVRPPRPSQAAEAPESVAFAADTRPATHRGGSPQRGTSDRPDRSAWPSQPGQAQRRSASPQGGAQRARGHAKETDSGSLRRPNKSMPDRKPVLAGEQEHVSVPTPFLTPEQAAEAQARHQRAVLLRSFEQSPLSKANFGALKGLSERALDALLAQAREERGAQ